MSQELDLDALEKLASEATPGPWHCHKKDEQREEFLMDFGGMFDKDGNHTGRPAMSGWISLRDRDAPYIAAANPDTILAMIARIRELESASQPGGGEVEAQTALRVMTALQQEAAKRRAKYGGDLYQARDVDPDVYDIAKSILERAGRFAATGAGNGEGV